MLASQKGPRCDLCDHVDVITQYRCNHDFFCWLCANRMRNKSIIDNEFSVLETENKVEEMNHSEKVI